MINRRLRSRPDRQDRVTTVILGVAVIWCAGLLAAAAVLPAYSSTSVSSSAPLLATADGRVPPDVIHTASATMVQENGTKILLPLAIPLLAVVAVMLMLHRRRSRARPGAGIGAWVVTAVLGGFCGLAMLTVGIFVLPVAALLAVACSRAPARRRPLAP